MRRFRRTAQPRWRRLSRDAWEANRPDTRALARLLGVQYLVGTAVLLIAVVIPAADTTDRHGLAIIGTAALAIGLFLRFAPRPGQLTVDCGISLAVFLVTAGVMVARPMGLVPLFYFWPLMLSAYYATPTQAIVNTALTIAGFGLAVATTAQTDDRALAFAELAAVVIVVVAAIARLRMKAAELFDQLQHVAELDPLTGTLNRRGFEERSRAVIADAQNSFADMSFIALDVDYFKQINDTRGHAAGDDVLRQLVRTLQGQIREADVLGRVGGEEFALVLPSTSAEQALQHAERLRGAVAEASQARGVPITVSCGVATAATLQQAWEQADRAMYRAKRSGRNQTMVVTDGP